MADIVAQPTIQAARAVILATKLGLEPSMAVCDFVQDVCEDRQIARTVEKALERYCPTEFTKGARDLLDLIRRGRAGGRPKSEFFGHCWGVFEGGGVRAAAHAGAYAAAKRAGITFGRVAGTSAGSIVGALVAAGKPKIWSPETTSDESVSLAPAPSGASIFFDGGVVSNLPAYILNNRRGNMAERDISPRILAFRLLAEDKGATPVQDLIDFCKRLSATVIDSASEIQLQLQTNVYPIDIHTGAIDSTDFEKLDEKNKRFLYGRGVRDRWALIPIGWTMFSQVYYFLLGGEFL
eukprot:gene23303-29516_t